jgi:hypothetical protein
MILVGNTGLQLAEKYPDHSGIRIAEAQFSSVSETRQLGFKVTANFIVHWGCKTTQTRKKFIRLSEEPMASVFREED